MLNTLIKLKLYVYYSYKFLRQVGNLDSTLKLFLREFKNVTFEIIFYNTDYIMHVDDIGDGVACRPRYI